MSMRNSPHLPAVVPLDPDW